MVAELSDKSFPKTMCPQDTRFSLLPASGWQILVEFVVSTRSCLYTKTLGAFPKP